MERKIQTLAQLFDTFGYKTKDTPRAIWREVFGEGLPDLSTKVTEDVIKQICTFLSEPKKGRKADIIEVAKELLNGRSLSPTIRGLDIMKNYDPVVTPISATSIRFEPKASGVSGVLGHMLEDSKMPEIKEPKQHEDAPGETNGSDWKHWLFAILCVVYAIGHAVLIWYDCNVLWPGKTDVGPGMIGGGLAFIFQMGVLVLAFDDRRPRTSSYALFVLLLVDIGAVFLHYPTFIQGTQVGPSVTMVFCGFVCLLSFSSLYLLRDSKIF